MNQLLKKKQNQLKAKKGFTLVELIIVIAIIAILAVIAIPKFSEIRENANVKADIATAKSIQSAVIVGVTNEEIKLPTSDTQELRGEYLKSYLNGETVPKVKANAKGEKGADFTAVIDTKGNVTVKAGSTQVLPNPEGPYKGKEVTDKDE